MQLDAAYTTTSDREREKQGVAVLHNRNCIHNLHCTMNHKDAIISEAVCLLNNPGLWRITGSLLCSAFFPFVLISISILWTWSSLSVVGLSDWIASSSLPRVPCSRPVLAGGGQLTCLSLPLSQKHWQPFGITLIDSLEDGLICWSTHQGQYGKVIVPTLSSLLCHFVWSLIFTDLDDTVFCGEVWCTALYNMSVSIVLLIGPEVQCNCFSDTRNECQLRSEFLLSANL